MRLCISTIILCSLLYIPAHTQTDIMFTNQLAEDIVLGNYDVDDYTPANPIQEPTEVVDYLLDNVSAISLKDYLIEMQQFNTRNTASDTTINGSGIGAARDWAHKKFESFNEDNGNRLIVSYLQFNRFICGVEQHRNIVAILPGVGEEKEELVIVEAHFDSRCEVLCNVDCTALGMEDNASGSGLVLEMARVMSNLTFDRTVMFMLTIGEEQGLFGADAMADYCRINEVPVHAVINNDVIGGVLCGETASPPGCPGLNDIDSINVRLYSNGTFNSKSKGLARFTKLEYHENMRDLMDIKPIINIMSSEDRVGRGGDHIPFREKGYAAIRFTSANEHGDAGIHPEYADRQHSVDDILGVDTDGDSEIDSFFVDFNYLKRNSLLNGNAAAMAAAGPQIPVLLAYEVGPGEITVTIEDDQDYNNYKVGLRSTTNDFDTILTTTQKVTTFTIDLSGDISYASVATIDENDIESLFSNERFIIPVSSTNEIASINQKLELLQNRPNPFDDQTSIGVVVHEPINYKTAHIEVIKPYGSIIYKTPIELNQGMNEIYYNHSYHHFSSGTLYYRLMIDGKHVQTKAMLYAY